jgi:PqqD family protein of HPr-rel-A system
MSDLRFSAAPDCEVVCWHDGCVVFDATQGQTHELSLDAGRVALILRDAREPLGAQAVCQQLATLVADEPASAAISAEAIDIILKELTRIGLATPQRA